MRRRTQRDEAAVHCEMERGLNSLASIACTAPLIGIFGTVLGIVSSFRGVAGELSVADAATAELLAESLLPTALSLLIALPAYWSYKYLRSQIEAFDLDMGNASSELVDALTNSSPDY